MPYILSPALKIFFKVSVWCLTVTTAVQNRTHLHPMLPRPPVSETKAWGFTYAQLHSKTSTAGCSLHRELEWPKIPTRSCCLEHKYYHVFICTQCFKTTTKKILGTSSFYHSSPPSVWKLHKRFCTALLFAAKNEDGFKSFCYVLISVFFED